MQNGAGRVLAVNVGAVRQVTWQGRTFTTGIWKSPVGGRVAVRGVNLIGDDQADRQVHGGPDKAVYAYTREDAAWWEHELGQPVAPGTFGENLTLRGIDVSGAVIGEQWEIGTTLLEVAQPRLPCWKLGVRMDDPGFPRRFAAAGRPGAYLRIVQEGAVEAEDQVCIVHRPAHGITVCAVADIYLHNHDRASELLTVQGLAESWRVWAEEIVMKRGARRRTRGGPPKGVGCDHPNGRS